MSSQKNFINMPNALLLKRLAAMAYDGLILMAISLGYTAAVLFMKVQFLGLTLATGEKAQMGSIGFVGLVTLLLMFYCFFWRRFGQTIGMKAWRLKLINNNGDPASLRQCLLRCIYAIISFLLFGIGYWWMLFGTESVTLHDKFSKTQVKQLPKGY